jgi:hypothetical protein
MLDAIAASTNDSSCEMPALPIWFPTNELLEIEKSVWSASNAEIKDGVLFSGSFKSVPFVEDWKSILVSFRARKMKENKLANQYILGTSFKGYHFFRR